MYSISLDMIRGIISIRMRGCLTDAQRVELADELKLALESSPPNELRQWLLRVTAKPVAQYTPELAGTVCRLIEERNTECRSRPPASSVVHRRPDGAGAGARLVNFITA